MGNMLIRLGHSPDSDDAFMFWGLACGFVKTEHQFEHILRDIQTLNEWAREGRLESTAISVHAYAHVSDKYALLRHGGSFGDGYGPMLVSRTPMTREELSGKTIAIPGLLTSSYLALNLYLPGAKTVVMDFDAIMPAVQNDRVEVGLIIHEGQLTHKEEGLHLIEDLGRWWKGETGGLPLPLGVNVVRRDLGESVLTDVSRAMRESIEAGLTHRQEALDYALTFARGMGRDTADEFVGMYVNDLTRDMGERGLNGIREFLRRGVEAGLVPRAEVTVID